MSLYKRILKSYRPFAGPIVLALVVQVAGIGFNLLKPWPLAWLIDTVLVPAPGGADVPPPQWFGLGGAPSAILAAAVATVGITFFAGLFGLVTHYLQVRIGLKALLRLRTDLYGYLQRLPLHFHDRRRSTDSTFRVAYDSQAIQTFFNRGFGTVVGSVITLVSTFLVMWSMDGLLAVLAFAVVPPLWLAIYFFAHRVRTQTARKQQEESDVLARATEGLTSIRVVHAFGREEHEVARFTHEATQSFDANLQLETTNALTTLVVGTIMALGTALILYFGAHHVLEGRLAVGQLVVFLSYLAMLYQPLEQLSYTAWALEGAAAGMQRVFEVLDTEDSVPESPGALPLVRCRGEIVFDRVSFGYEPEHPILQDIAIRIEPGQTIALVGGTGAGKTTLLSLVPRFYDPIRGAVLLDGHDIRQYTKRSLRDHMALVLQDTVLLSGTIRDNIAYGRLGATRADILAAAKAACADDFIASLPQGYDTEVGERGVRLSGGQRQRIGIARAFLKSAPLLLLDEPTSALDLETEAEIMATLKALMARQTTLIVTHRLPTIHHADKIFVLENGRVVESGTGPSLLASNGVYARLWNAAKLSKE